MEASEGITLIFVLVGWIVVYQYQGRVETRKEIRSLIDSLRTRLKQLEIQAINYHLSDADFVQEKRILSEIQLVSNDIEQLGLVLSCDLRDEAYCLRKSITLNNFETKDHVKLNNSDILIKSIFHSVGDLIVTIERSYNDVYWSKSAKFMGIQLS